MKFEGECKILSTCVILALKVKRLLHKGCEAYLAHVVNKSYSKVTLDSVPIVREFSNVLLEDFPGLPPDRELKFGIEYVVEISSYFYATV